MQQSMRGLISIVSSLLLLACSDSDGSSSSPPTLLPPATPPTPPPAPDPWSEVKAAVDASPIANMLLIVGDANGEVFSYEKGEFAPDRISRVASASKLLAGITITRLTEATDIASGDAILSLEDNPQDHIPWWTGDSNDQRSRVTLEQLLSFRSGLNYSILQSPCAADSSTTLEDCAMSFYDRGVLSEPGDEFFYGPGHMTVAGHMVEQATGIGYADFFEAELASALGLLNTKIENPSRANPRVAGGAESTPAEYSEILRALLAGELITDLNAFTRDRTDSVSFLERPSTAELFGDWHYGLGFWRECDGSQFSAACSDEIVISSPGAFGWTPWIDFQNNYYALIASEDSDGGLIEIGEGPSMASVELEQTLQPLIVEVLEDMTSTSQNWVVTSDIEYVSIPGTDPNLLSLDVYEPVNAAAPGPVMIMVHGGGWVMGDKAGDGGPQPPLLFPKMPYFIELGWTFVSVNYRLTNTELPLGDPQQATYPSQPQDLAAAVSWVHQNINQFNGDPDRIVLMGHSAGATMVAQVGTNEEFLEAHGMSLFDLSGVIPLDGFYDVPRQLPQGAPYLPLVFTEDPAVWADASPPNHVEDGKGIPPMLLVYQGVNFNGNSPSHAIQMEELLTDAGIQAEAFDSLKSHADLGSDIGIPGDRLSDKVDEYIASLSLQ